MARALSANDLSSASVPFKSSTAAARSASIDGLTLAAGFAAAAGLVACALDAAAAVAWAAVCVCSCVCVRVCVCVCVCA